MAFTNPFLSLAGQKERIANVGAVLNAAFNPFSKQSVVATTGNKTLNTALQSVANHPYVAAGVIAAAAAPAAALGTARAGISIVGQSAKNFVINNPIKSVALVPTGIIGANILLSSAKARQSFVGAPSSLANFGQNIGKVIEHPSYDTGKELFTDNPILTTGALIAGAATIGGGIGLGANTIATYLNSKATAANTNAPGSPIPIELTQLPAQSPVVAAPEQVAPAGDTPKKKPKKKKKSAKKKKKTRRSKKKAKKKTSKKKKKTRRSKKKKTKKRKR